MIMMMMMMIMIKIATITITITITMIMIMIMIQFQIEFACPHASDGIRIRLSTQGFSAVKCVQSMRHKVRDGDSKYALLLLLCRPIG